MAFALEGQSRCYWIRLRPRGSRIVVELAGSASCVVSSWSFDERVVLFHFGVDQLTNK